MFIIINALGISDSGGITVLKKMLNEIIKSKKYNFFIFLFENSNTQKLYNEFRKYPNIKFKFIKNRGLIYRILFENIYFYYFSKKNSIELVYNVSGTVQFLSSNKQLVKVQNLLFYSKKLDKVYFENKDYKNWIKHIFLKRLFFKSMLTANKNIEIQADHVKYNLSDFIDISDKNFFLKSDFDIDSESFKTPEKYDFSKKITFLYIVGPHFYMPHKNIKDFIDTMQELSKSDFDFEIKITLTQEELEKSGLWDNELTNKTEFLGYVSKDKIEQLFQNNTILISTSVIETLGLHVIEATLNGILVIAPNENYSKCVYGGDILTYRLFNVLSLVQAINKIILLKNNKIKDIIYNNQHYLIERENIKVDNIVEIFDKIIKKGIDVQ